MKDIITIDEKYGRQFYPADAFEGLGMPDSKHIAKSVGVCFNSDKYTDTKIGVAHGYTQFVSTLQKKNMTYRVSAVCVDHKRADGKPGLALATVFPIVPFWSEKVFRIVVNDVHIFNAGEVIIEGALVDDKHRDGVSVEFQDVDFFTHDHNYTMSKEYHFVFGGIAYKFDRRKKEDLILKLDEEGPNGEKEINTAAVDAFLSPSSGNNGAGFTTIYQPFLGFKTDTYKTPFSKNEAYIYNYVWNKGPVDLNFPIFVGENVLKNYQPNTGEPVDIGVIVQGMCQDNI